jgi:hypothetical protein
VTTGILADGVHTLTAQATDAAGNVSTASLTLEVTTDTLAPAKPTLDLDPASDSGTSDSDNLTSDSTPTLNGAAEAGSTVDIYDDGTFLQTVTAATDGTWTATLATLADGGHPLTATATDTSGNTSSVSDTLTVTVDTGSPNQPTIDLDAASDTGSSSTDDITSDTTPTLSGLAEPGSSVQVLDGSTSLGTAVAGSGGTWTLTPAALSSATHSFTASATDAAGNASGTSAALPVVVDTVAPVVSLVTTIANGGTYYFGSVPVQPTCVATDALAGLAGPCTISGYGSTVGSHTVTAGATDRAGNTASVGRTYTVAPWTVRGFYSPIDLGGVVNTVKGGSTVPVKFELFAGSRELTATTEVVSITAQRVNCSSSAPVDAIETTVATGGTALRYDSTAGQFIYNWKTPAGANTCYLLTMTARDGSTQQALFRMK